MSLIFRNFMGIYKPYIAMTNQDKKANLTPEQEEINRLRSEVHNLKRQVKRLKEKDQVRKAEQKAEQKALKKARRQQVKAEIMEAGMEDLKKKLVEEGFGERTLEVVEWFVSEATGTQKK